MNRVNGFFIIVIALVVGFGCAEKKPEFLITENYQYLTGKRKKVLVLINVFVDMVQQKYNTKPDPKIKKLINNYDFKQGYRWKLAKELYNIDKGQKLQIDFSEKAEDDNIMYYKYMGKKYPGSFKSKGYDLALEVDMKVLLFNNMGFIDMMLSEKIRLVDVKTNDVHLSSYTSRSYGSIGRRVPLSKDLRRLRLLLQNIINLSTGKLAMYIFNKEKKPHVDDIAPALPTFQKK
ncbi:MAG: hypothetical protein OEZ36_08930 [Spirochaetota bacterium]|nr:hypothetical protein [Spirochaetota bacterium]